MRILLLGKYGQLGWELQRTLPLIGDLTAIDRDDIDLVNLDSFRHELRNLTWDVLVNASAYTNVEKAEEELETAKRINADAPRIMAEEVNQRKGIFIHFSTDYVFDGLKTEPYIETDQTNPSGIYARTKFDGEKGIEAAGGASFIFRTSWVYSMRGDNFVTKVIKWSGQNKEMRIVTDQTASPTWARTLAELTSQALFQIIQRGPDWDLKHRGIYHLASSDYVNRYELARYIVHRMNIPISIHPALTRDFPSAVERPKFSALSTSLFSEIFNLRVPGWQEMLDLALEK